MRETVRSRSAKTAKPAVVYLSLLIDFSLQ